MVKGGKCGISIIFWQRQSWGFGVAFNSNSLINGISETRTPEGEMQPYDCVVGNQSPV